MERDEVMEAISYKIRNGEPVGFLEAIAAINYQGQLKQHAADNTMWRRLVRLFRRHAQRHGGKNGN